MDKVDLDDILLTMLNSFGSDVSDLNCTVSKPLQVEHEGSLIKVGIEPDLALDYLSPFQTASMVLGIIGEDSRAMEDLLKNGSCDLAYPLRKDARFRVNIFSAKRHYAIVLRKLQTVIPTLDDLKSPEIFKKIIFAEIARF